MAADNASQFVEYTARGQQHDGVSSEAAEQLWPVVCTETSQILTLPFTSNGDLVSTINILIQVSARMD